MVLAVPMIIGLFTKASICLNLRYDDRTQTARFTCRSKEKDTFPRTRRRHNARFTAVSTRHRSTKYNWLTTGENEQKEESRCLVHGSVTLFSRYIIQRISFLPDWGRKFGTHTVLSTWHKSQQLAHNCRPSWICKADDLRCSRKPTTGLPLLNGGAILVDHQWNLLLGLRNCFRRLPSSARAERVRFPIN